MGFGSKARQLLIACLLLPVSAWGTLTVTDRGTSGNTTSQPSTVFSPASTIASGSGGVFYLAADNGNGASSNLPTSVVDSVGNTWYQGSESTGGIANNAVETAIYYCPRLATALTSSDNITITYTAANVAAKAATFTEVAPSAGNAIILRGRATTANGTSGTPSVTGEVASIGDVTFGGCGAESADTFTGDSDTSNGSWSTKQSLGEGTGVTGMSVITQWKVQTTATSTQTFNPTLTSADYRLDVFIFKEGDTKVRAVGSNGANASSVTISPTLPLSAGSTAALVLACDNSVSGGATIQISTTPISDSAGNTWTLRQDAIYDPGVANAGVELGIWTSTLTSNMSLSDTLVVTFTTTSVPVKSWVMFEFSNSTAYAGSNTGGGASTSTPSLTTGSITTPNIVVGVLGYEGDAQPTADSDSSNGTWSSGGNVIAGSGGLNSMGIIAQYKSTTGSGTQTYNPTLGSSQDSILGYVELTVPSTNTNTQYLHFLDFF